MSLVKEGWIEKKGQTFMAGYKKRWLVLYSDKTLKYYEDNYYEILKGSIDISEASKVQNSMENSKNWKFGWEIVTATRNWYFSSKSDHDRKQWIQNVQTVMDYTSSKASSVRMSYKRHKRLKNIAKENEMNQTSNTTTTPLITHNEQENKIDDIDDDEFGNEDKRTQRTNSLDAQLKIAKNNSNNKSKTDEYIPGLYSSSFNRGRSPSPKETKSKFGKDYKRITNKTMTEMVNKHVSLSIKSILLQSKQNEKEAKEEENEDRFIWEPYDTKIHELIKKDENNANDMDNQDELKCFCGANIKKITCDQNSRLVLCQFCGQHKISEGAQYFECEDGINDIHDNNGWSVCCYCCYHELIQKYYNPLNLFNDNKPIKPRRIGISVMIERVSNIDSMNQSFRAKLLLSHSWKPTKEEVELFKDKPTDFDPFWMPQFSFPSCIEIHDMGFKQSHWSTEYMILRKGESNNDSINPLPYIITGECWIDATFSEVFELESFPVDCQDLTIRIQSQQYTSICIFDTPFQAQNILTILNEYSTIPQWNIHTPKFEIIKKNIGPVIQYSLINLSIKLQRIPQPYLWRMVLFLVLLTTTSLIAFSIDILEYGADRITYLMTLLLTAVAYQFVILQDLPKVSYLTLMDKYILQTFFFIFTMLIETVIVMAFESETADKYCSYIFWAIFICVQIVFIYLTKRAKIYEIGKLKHSSSDMDKYCNKKRSVGKLIQINKFGSNNLLPN